MLARIMVALVVKLMTEAFVSKAIVLALSSLAKNSTNTVDDKMVEALAEALGCTDVLK